MTDEEFASNYSAVKNDLPQKSSIFAWNMLLFNDSAFDQLSEMLPDLSIPWVYQSIPLTIYLIHKPDGDGRKSFPAGHRDRVFDWRPELAL